MSGLFAKALGAQLVSAGIATEKQLEMAQEKAQKQAQKSPTAKGYKPKTGGKRKGKGRRAQAPAKADAAASKIEVIENRPSQQVSKKSKANELIKKHIVIDHAADQTFNFNANGKLRQITVTAAQAELIAQAELAIVKTDVSRDPYVLIPAAAAITLRELLPARVIAFYDQPETELDETSSD